MSRSRKKPIHSITTAASDKPFKVIEHRRERHSARQVIANTMDMDDPRLHAVYGDPWNAPKDGKRYNPDWPKAYRK